MTTGRDSPNILFLMTDQQRFDALSSHNGWVKTPHLDRLAAQGVDLRKHYSQAPVCVPSRCSLFTGRYPHAHRVLENDARLAAHEVHLFKALKQAGYRLSYSGKNHLMEDADLKTNFDTAFSHDAADDTSSDISAYRTLEQESLARLSTHGSFASAAFHDFPDEVTCTGRIANHLINEMERLPSDGGPWCMVGSFSDPHVPHLAPRRFEKMYPLSEMTIPESNASELDAKAGRLKLKRELQLVDRASEEEKRRYLAVYGSMCSFVDEQIGRVLEVLSQREDADRTIVVFVSDHGDFCWHLGLVKKDLVLCEHLLHVPAILHFPKRFKPRVVDDTFTEHVDIVPTLLDLAGLEVPFGCQGKSLLPLIEGEVSTHRDETFAEVCYPWMRNPFPDAASFFAARNGKGAVMQGAPFNVPGDYTKSIRTERWRYIWYGDGFEELYDTASDPDERFNLAGKKQSAEVCRELRLRLFEWLAKTADPLSPKIERKHIQDFDTWVSS